MGEQYNLVDLCCAQYIHSRLESASKVTGRRRCGVIVGCDYETARVADVIYVRRSYTNQTNQITTNAYYSMLGQLTV